MKFLQPKTFRDATSPMTITGWVLGIGTIEYPTGHPRRALSICWSIMWLILILNSIRIARVQDPLESDRPLAAKLSYWMFLIMAVIIVPTTIYCGQLYSKDIVESSCKIIRVDAMLSKLGIPTKYSSIFKHQIASLVGVLCFGFTLAMYRLYFNILSTTLAGFIIEEQYVSVTMFQGDYIFSSYIRYIGYRLQHLNTYLTNLYTIADDAKGSLRNSKLHQHNLRFLSTTLDSHVSTRSDGVVEEQRMIHILRNAKRLGLIFKVALVVILTPGDLEGLNVEDMKSALYTLVRREIHCELCSAAKILNEVFGARLVVSTIMAFLSITVLLFVNCSDMATPEKLTTSTTINFLMLSFWILLFIIKILFIVSSCSMTSSEAQRTGDLIHEFIDPTSGNEMREEIRGFSLYLMQNHLEFTACGFFTIDYGMIYTMGTAVTTYLVLMFQIPGV